jgi:hypothetical protein
MPRAKAAPDPAIEQYTSRAGRTYRIEAYRNGCYLVHFGDQTLINRPPQLGAYFGAPRWPSNRLQAEAMAEAKQRAEELRDEQH